MTKYKSESFSLDFTFFFFFFNSSPGSYEIYNLNENLLTNRISRMLVIFRLEFYCTLIASFVIVSLKFKLFRMKCRRNLLIQINHICNPRKFLHAHLDSHSQGFSKMTDRTYTCKCLLHKLLHYRN